MSSVSEADFLERGDHDRKDSAGLDGFGIEGWVR